MKQQGRTAKTVVEVRQVSKRYGVEGGRRADACITQALDRVGFAVAAGGGLWE